MEVTILEEHGYESALRGLSYSFKDRATLINKWWTPERFEKMKKTGTILSHREGGHNKWIESIALWVDIEAPRYWWSEFDTYRVGTTKQSESTMHTLTKRHMTIDDCAYTPYTKFGVEEQVKLFNRYIDEATIQEAKQMIPEAYLQRRLVCTNYKVLRNIIFQRYDHRLPEWKTFCEAVYTQSEHPELLPRLDQ